MTTEDPVEPAVPPVSPEVAEQAKNPWSESTSDQGFYLRPRQDSNLRSRLRRAVLYPLSYGGPAFGPKETVPAVGAGRPIVPGGFVDCRESSWARFGAMSHRILPKAVRSVQVLAFKGPRQRALAE